jgi:hypothetical protein
MGDVPGQESGAFLHTQETTWANRGPVQGPRSILHGKGLDLRRFLSCCASRVQPSLLHTVLSCKGLSGSPIQLSTRRP